MLNAIKNRKVVSVYKPIDFPIIENEKISDEFDVIATARQQAKKDQPNSSSESPDSNEINYHQKLETKLMQASHSVQQALNDLGNDINNLSIKQQISESENTPQEFDQHMASKLSPKFRELKGLKEKLDLADEDLQQFKSKNRLNREADYPSSNWKTFGILFFALLIEGSLNGLFFAEGSDTGLAGGIGIALLVAAINIAPGFLIGWMILRYKNHFVKWKSNLGISISIIALILPVFFNLYVAHYRGALITAPDEASQYVLQSIEAGWFSVSDLNSWLLFGIGLVFYILASYKGYTFDDAYPSYGKFARLKDKASDELSEEKDDILAFIDESCDECIESLENNYELVKRQNTSLSNSISSFEVQNTIFKNYCRHLSGTMKYVIQLYRDINSAERTSPPPNYFTKAIEFELSFEPLSFTYKDKRDEIHQAKEKLEISSPNLKEKLLRSKSELHGQIDEICH